MGGPKHSPGKERKKHGIIESIKSKEKGHFLLQKEVVRDIRC